METRAPSSISSIRSATGFTLLEIMASIAVFIFLVLFVAQLMNNVSSVTNSSRNRMQSEDQVRMVFDRIEQDISRMVKRSDVDYYFKKSASGSDPFFFYAEAAGYSLSSSANQSDTSLLGYRVNSNSQSSAYQQLERYAAALPWDTASTGGLLYLTYTGGVGSCAPVASTLLATNAAVATTSTDARFHVLGEDVFRIEFCYQLKDGSYSTEPVLFTPPSDWNGGTFYTSAGSAPSTINASPSYSIGSRWYDTSTGRGYICLSATASTANQATWRFIGWRDVSAIVVTLAILDATNRSQLAAMGKDLGIVASALPKIQNTDLQASSPTLPAQKWQQEVDSGGLTSVMPKKMAYAVQIKQRFFYLNTQ